MVSSWVLHGANVNFVALRQPLLAKDPALTLTGLDGHLVPYS